VLGLGPVPVHLARIAVSAGFEVVLHTPDDLTADAVRDLEVGIGGPAEPENLGNTDSRSAIVFAFHDHEREERLLPAALASDAFYIGAMGSHATQARRLEHLGRTGFASSQLERIHGPAGLLPHARSASDLALSILAQVVEAARRAEDIAAASPTPAIIPPDIRRRGHDEAPPEARL